ncbi:MAG: peptide antibiotic transporter SbmA [Pseudomonadota bacterium]
MFTSFFPNPKVFFGSAVLYAIVCVCLWFFLLRDLGAWLSLGWLIGFGYPIDPDAEEATSAAEAALAFWRYQYVILCYVLFVAVWMRIAAHRWALWSVAGSATIVFVTWFQVQIDVFINFWYRDFYDLVQVALSEPNSISAGDFYSQIATILFVVMPAIILLVLKFYFTQHFVFRWRTAMNERYMSMWERVRHIEGASQRVQDDTMRFARIVETLGVNIIDSFMTLIAFLPILWGLSVHVQELPIIGQVPQALVIIAILWSVFGTGLLALAGIRLPGLEFRNQRVEASYRKELVLGEDDEARAQPPEVAELFGYVRQNYFRLYLEYMYFNVVRYSYLQFGNIIPFIALGPTIVAAGITFGLFQQILNAFNRVENSFQFLVNAWPTIIELMSIQKRLAAFERTIEGKDLGGIELEGETRPAE